MRYSLVILSLFIGCGSGGGDSKVEEGAVVVQPSPNPQANLYCEHDGRLYLNVNGLLEPADEESVEAVEETTDALGQVTKAITINGSVTVIAECGSSVDFQVNNTEDNRVTEVPNEVVGG